jgi:hypothetical protein
VQSDHDELVSLVVVMHFVTPQPLPLGQAPPVEVSQAFAWPS